MVAWIAQKPVCQNRVDAMIEDTGRCAAEQGLVAVLQQADDDAHGPPWVHAGSRSPSRSSRFRTVETCQRPHRRVSMPRALSSPAMARRLVAPRALMLSIGIESCPPIGVEV